MEAFLAKQRERNAAEDRIKKLSTEIEIMAAEIELKAAQGTASYSEREFYEAGLSMADAYERVGLLLQDEIALFEAHLKAAIPDPVECERDTARALAGYQAFGGIPDRYFEAAAAWRREAES